MTSVRVRFKVRDWNTCEYCMAKQYTVLCCWGQVFILLGGMVLMLLGGQVSCAGCTQCLDPLCRAALSDAVLTAIFSRPGGCCSPSGLRLAACSDVRRDAWGVTDQGDCRKAGCAGGDSGTRTGIRIV